MPNNSPSLVPRQPRHDATAYIVLDDFGPKLGRAYRETNEAQADEKTVVENMISGQYSTLSASSPSTSNKVGRVMCLKI